MLMAEEIARMEGGGGGAFRVEPLMIFYSREKALLSTLLTATAAVVSGQQRTFPGLLCWWRGRESHERVESKSLRGRRKK